MTDLETVTESSVIGYLTNVYPAVSHSFIKREILALEAQGIKVHRWSIRACAPDLPDPSDRREAERTETILAGKTKVVLAAVLTLLRQPLKFHGALRACLKGRPAGARILIVRLAYLAEACLLAQSARQRGVRHIHAHFGTNPATVARLSYLLGGPSYSFTVHGPDEFDQPIVHDLAGKVADAKFVVAISDYGRSQLMRWCDMADWPKLNVVRCGLDQCFLSADFPQIPDDAERTLVCVARLAPQKGLPILIEAAASLKQAGQDFRIVIVGDGDLRPRLEHSIRAGDLEGMVELRGAASMAVVRSEILAARAFVLPSFAEGLPVSIMEALSLGRPVITTRIAGISELVDEACGRVVSAGDVASLCAAITEILDAPVHQLRDMGKIGRQRVLSAHDAEINAQKLATLFAAVQT